MNIFEYLLIDLDGTLIKFDLDAFIERYLNLIRKHLSDKPFVDEVPLWILQGTDLMLKNNGSVTNREKFLNYFKEQSGMPEQEIWSLIPSSC